MRTLLTAVLVALFLAIAGSSTARAQVFTVDVLEVDGVWCPMAHCNRADDSFEDLRPLLSVGSVERVREPVLSPGATIHLGCFSGESFAVCANNSLDQPALVAYDYQDGSVKWLSLPEDLRGTETRRVSGILMARMGFNGSPVNRYVFAANPLEFVAYNMNGQRVWMRSNKSITPAAPDGIGAPISITFNDARELIAVTGAGWIVKLNPADGSPIDAYKMDTNVVVGTSVYQGTFTTSNYPVVVGNALYLAVEFQADASNPLDPSHAPVYMVRIDLNQPGVPGMEHRIRPLTRPLNPSDPTPDRAAIGVRKATGSPSAFMGTEGKVILIAAADVFQNQQFWPGVASVTDDQGVLSRRWRSVLNSVSGDEIRSAPALHKRSGTLLVATANNIYVFRDVKNLKGEVSPPVAAPLRDLITCGIDNVSAKAEAGSPIGLTYNRGTNEVVGYTNFRVTPIPGSQAYGYLAAFAFPAKGPVIGRALWCSPLGPINASVSRTPKEIFGQPAMFRYSAGGSESTGLMVSTIASGTLILKSQAAANANPSDLVDAVNMTETAAALKSKGYRLRPAWMSYECGGANCKIGSSFTWYGFVFLPVDGARPVKNFRFNGDDAFVVYGITPPPITYYSFSTYLNERYNATLGRYIFLGTNIGLNVNQGNINRLGGTYDNYFAVIVAADHATANAVHRSLREAGVPEGSISRLLYPSRFTDTGQQFPDTLSVLMRMTFRTVEEEQRISGYMGQQPPNVRVLYFDGPGAAGNVLDSDLPTWEETLRLDTSEKDSGVETDLDFLVNQIVSKHRGEGFGLKGTSTQILWHHTQGTCGEIAGLCGMGYPAPDALYGHFSCPGIPSGQCEFDFGNPSDFLIVAGVDHHQFADDTLLTYFSYQLPGGDDFGVRSSLIDVETVGSAAPYLDGTGKDPSRLYTLKIARSCGGEPYCMEVPLGSFRMTMRIYLDKKTDGAPNPKNLVRSKLIWFVK